MEPRSRHHEGPWLSSKYRLLDASQFAHTCININIDTTSDCHALKPKRLLNLAQNRPGLSPLPAVSLDCHQKDSILVSCGRNQPMRLQVPAAYTLNCNALLDIQCEIELEDAKYGNANV